MTRNLSREAQAFILIIASKGGAAPRSEVEAEFERVRPDLMSDEAFEAWAASLAPAIQAAYKERHK